MMYIINEIGIYCILDIMDIRGYINGLLLYNILKDLAKNFFGFKRNCYGVIWLTSETYNMSLTHTVL